MSDVGDKLPPSPRVRSPRQFPPLPPVPVVPIHVVDVPASDISFTTSTCSNLGILRIPAGLHEVPNTSNRTPGIPEGLQPDVQMQPVVTIFPQVARVTPSATIEGATSIFEPFRQTQEKRGRVIPSKSSKA